jgi:hypothetical protein
MKAWQPAGTQRTLPSHWRNTIAPGKQKNDAQRAAKIFCGGFDFAGKRKYQALFA